MCRPLDNLMDERELIRSDARHGSPSDGCTQLARPEWALTPMETACVRCDARRVSDVIDMPRRSKGKTRWRRPWAAIVAVELLYVLLMVLAVPTGRGAVALALGLAFVLSAFVGARLSG